MDGVNLGNNIEVAPRINGKITNLSAREWYNGVAARITSSFVILYASMWANDLSNLFFSKIR